MLYAVQSVHDSSLHSIHRAILMVSQSKKEDNKSVKKSTKKYSICFSLTSQLTISNPSRLLSIIQLAMKYSYEHVSIDLCSSPTQNELPSVPLFDIYQNIVPEEKNIQESYPSISVSFFRIRSKTSVEQFRCLKVLILLLPLFLRELLYLLARSFHLLLVFGNRFL